MKSDDRIDKDVKLFRSRISGKPELGVILGSGQSDVLPLENIDATFKFSQLQAMEPCSVPGHGGYFEVGNIGGLKVIIQRGRLHYYEGFDIDQVTYSVRLMHALGIETLVVCNASGAINDSLVAGDIVVIVDHINMMGVNPLRHLKLPVQSRLVDMTGAYDQHLRELFYSIAEQLGIEVTSGVYAAMPGPSYETPAEVRMLSLIGADIVGMSTVPEVIMATALGIRVLGLSIVANIAAGMQMARITHLDILKAISTSTPRLNHLLNAFINRMPNCSQ